MLAQRFAHLQKTSAPWQPGAEGKGLVLDGQVHHWATEEGAPHHEEVYTAKTERPHGGYEDLIKAKPFWIGKDGGVEIVPFVRGQEGYDRVQEAKNIAAQIPGSYAKPDTGVWNFSKIAAGPKVVVAPDADARHQDRTLLQRRPIIFNPREGEDGTAYVGHPGWHHTGIADSHGIDMDRDFDRYSYGFMGPNNYDGHSYAEPHEINWYHHAQGIPRNHEEVSQAILDNLGVKGSVSDPHEWDFS